MSSVDGVVVDRGGSGQLSGDARRAPATHPRHRGATHAKAPHVPKPKASHGATPGAGTSLNHYIELGTIVSYDAPSNTAMIALKQSTTRQVGPLEVTATAPRDLALVGATCLVILRDAHNPSDGVVAAVWPTVGAVTQLGAKFSQAGTQSIALAGVTSASASLVFPTPFSSVPGVVACSGDGRCYATVSGVGASGATLTVVSASGATLTATVAVPWIAVGV